MKEGTSEEREWALLKLSFECQCVFAIEAGAGKVHAAEWEGLHARTRALFHRRKACWNAVAGRVHSAHNSKQ